MSRWQKPGKGTRLSGRRSSGETHWSGGVWHRKNGKLLPKGYITLNSPAAWAHQACLCTTNLRQLSPWLRSLHCCRVTQHLPLAAGAAVVRRPWLFCLAGMVLHRGRECCGKSQHAGQTRVASKRCSDMVIPSQLCSIRSACLQQSCALRASRLPSSRAQTLLKHSLLSKPELHCPWLGADVAC